MRSLAQTASWVIRHRETGKVIMETFKPRLVAKINVEKYEAVPILAYLQGLNRGEPKREP